MALIIESMAKPKTARESALNLDWAFDGLKIGWSDLSREFVEEKHANPATGSFFLDVSGVRTHCRVDGAGPTVICLHGICDSLHTWDDWAQVLSHRSKVVRIDLPGFGLSDRLPTPSPEAFADFIDKLNIELGISGPVTLVGNSLGGYFSSYYAATRPEKVEKLILLSPAAYPLKQMPWPIELGRLPLLNHFAKRLTPLVVLRKTVRALYGDPSAICEDVVLRWYDLLLAEGNRENYFEMFTYMQEHRYREPLFLSQIRAETLLMWGTRDRWLPYSQAAHWQEDVPHLELQLYKNCGHMPQLEIPFVSADHAFAFLNKKRFSSPTVININP